MYFGKNLRCLRKEHSLSQEDIANRLGYKSYTTIQKWESDVTTPDMKTVNQLAEMFGVSMEDLANTDLSAQVKKEDKEHNGFSDDEIRLIESYRKLNPILKDYIIFSVANAAAFGEVRGQFYKEKQAPSTQSGLAKMVNSK
jgi:transcriptional regulator with XRE-family HTH domain